MSQNDDKPTPKDVGLTSGAWVVGWKSKKDPDKATYGIYVNEAKRHPFAPAQALGLILTTGGGSTVPSLVRIMDIGQDWWIVAPARLLTDEMDHVVRWREQDEST